MVLYTCFEYILLQYCSYTLALACRNSELLSDCMHAKLLKDKPIVFMISKEIDESYRTKEKGIIFKA